MNGCDFVIWQMTSDAAILVAGGVLATPFDVCVVGGGVVGVKN